MTSPCRIGLFTPGWPGQNTSNGIATSVYNLALGLHEIGAAPVILADRIDAPDGPPDIPVIHIPELPWHWQDRLYARLGHPDAGHWHRSRTIVAAVEEAMATHGLDTVIMEETNGWAGMVQKLARIPVIVTLHGPWAVHKSVASQGDVADRQRENREARAFKAAGGIIAPSRNVLTAIDNHVTLQNTPRTVIPNAFPSESGAPLSVGLQARDILFVGRFDRHKGGDTVLQAFAYLKETHPQARLTFAGFDKGVRQENGSTLHIEGALAALPEDVRADVTWTGPLGRAEVARLRETHVIALIASRYENLNYTLLEAMAAGQAIVCTAVGGPADVLEDGRTALLVPPEDPEAMAAALARLIDDAKLARRLGEIAQARLAEDFSPEKIARETVEFVQTVLKSHARG